MEERVSLVIREDNGHRTIGRENLTSHSSYAEKLVNERIKEYADLGFKLVAANPAVGNELVLICLHFRKET